MTNNLGQIGSKCRISVLVIDNPKFGALSAQSKHGLDEVVSEWAADPRRAQDKMARVGQSDTMFTCKLTTSVDANRSRGVRLYVRRTFAPIKDVVGRKMNDRGSGLCSGLGDGFRAHGVDRLGEERFILCLIDGGVGCRINNHIWPARKDGVSYRIRIG